MTDHHPFSKFTKWFNNTIFSSRFAAHTHRPPPPRQNKDDSTFEQGSNKTVIVIKNKNAVSGCHGNQHSRTPGNVVKHATEHKAAKQVKRLFIRLQHVVQCPLVRAQETHKGVQHPGGRCEDLCHHRPGALSLSVAGTERTHVCHGQCMEGLAAGRATER